MTLTYLSIDSVINRLNDVLGSGWSTAGSTQLIPGGDGFVAVCELTLTATIDGAEKTAYCVGADKGKDTDKIVKTALAEAIKKGGHQLGVGLYLWDAEARKRAETSMKLAKSDSEATLKRAVFELAEQKLGKKPGSAAEVAKVFGVKPGELADKAVLQKILKDEGVL